MKWPSPQEIVALRSTLDAASMAADDDFSFYRGEEAESKPDPAREAEEHRCRRIRFDNAIRIWVAVPTYLTCLALWSGGAISSLLPITAVIVGYASAIYGTFTAFYNSRFTRLSDYSLSFLDLVAMTAAVYLTGATRSPLYFVYFVPVVIHAFHRDWNLILFSGFGGVVLYGVGVLMSLRDVSSAAVADLFARLVFMLLTVAVACLALSVLRKEEERDRRRIARLRAASVVGHWLNRACSASEIVASCGDVAPVIAAALSVEGARVRMSFVGRTLAGVRATPGAAPLEAGQTSVPVAVDGQFPYGLVSVSSGSARLNDSDRKFLRFVARSIALCVRRYEMIDELARSVEMGTAVAAVYLAASRSDSAAETAILEGARALLGADRATVYLWNDVAGRLDAVASSGERAGNESVSSFLPNDGAIGQSFSRGQSVTIGQGGEAEDDADDRFGRFVIAVPLVQYSGETVGVLAVARMERGTPFTEDDSAVAAAFASRCAHALAAALQHRPAAVTPGFPRLAA